MSEMRPSPESETPEAGGAGRFVLVVALFLLLYWAAAATVIAVDPYDVRSWGHAVRVPARLTLAEDRVLALAASKSRRFDTVVIGSSTAAPYSPDALGKALGGREVLNFSYPGARPADRHLITEAFAKNSDADRFVIFIDWSYLAPEDNLVDGWPGYLFDADPTNDLRLVSIQGLRATADVVAGRPPFVGNGPGAIASTERAWGQLYNTFQRPKAMRKRMADFDAAVATLKPGSPTSCDAFPTLNDQLLPALRTLSKRGKTVDLVLPAYSVVFYGYTLKSNDVDLFRLLAFRRCMAAAVDTIPGVQAWALDGNTDLISDLGNYRDAAHLYRPEALASALAGIGDPRYRLTGANAEAFNEKLLTTVRTYRYRNSQTDPEAKREPRVPS